MRNGLLPKVVILLLVSVNIILLYLLSSSGDAGTGRFLFLDPRVSEMEIDEYNAFKESAITNFADLRTSVSGIISNSGGNYSFYYEDLKTGAWVGIGEKNVYVQASLGKIPILTAIMKKVEDKSIKIDDYLIVNESDFDFRFGKAILKEETTNITIRNLLRYLTENSDNTAYHTLMNNLSDDELFQSIAGLGLPITLDFDTQGYSPKQVANSFRALYMATYLSRPYSRFTLALLANDAQPSFIKGPIPSDVKVSHKVGDWIDNPDGYSYVHDCGIVYHHVNPYMICIMSKHKEAMSDLYVSQVRKAFYDISKEVYDYVSSH
jgi:hypothetical protein